MSNWVWIVEMHHKHGKYEPTVGCALNRVDARKKLNQWKERNPSDKFRLNKYWRDNP